MTSKRWKKRIKEQKKGDKNKEKKKLNCHTKQQRTLLWLSPSKSLWESDPKSIVALWLLVPGVAQSELLNSSPRWLLFSRSQIGQAVHWDFLFSNSSLP